MGEKKGPVFHASDAFKDVRPSSWKFPKHDHHKVWNIDELLDSAFGEKLKETLHASDLGQFILAIAREVNPSIVFINDPKMTCYGEYIPYEGNLETTRLPMDRPVISINEHEVDKGFLPYIMGHEMFHMLQDYVGRVSPARSVASQYDADEALSSRSRLTPMARSGIVYNNDYKLGDYERFFKSYYSMEMACDIFSLCLCYLASERSRSGNFGEFSQNPHFKPLADAISAAMRYGADSDLDESTRVNLALFNAAFAAMRPKNNEYYSDHYIWGQDIHGETSKDPRFEMVPDVKTISFKNFMDYLGFQFSLLPTGFKQFCFDGGVNEHRRKIEDHRSRRARIGYRVQATIGGGSMSGLRFN